MRGVGGRRQRGGAEKGGTTEEGDKTGEGGEGEKREGGKTTTTTRVIRLYNAEHTTGKETLCARARRGGMIQYATGKLMRLSAQAVLWEEAERQGYRSNVWLRKRELGREGKGVVELKPGMTGVVLSRKATKGGENEAKEGMEDGGEGDAVPEQGVEWFNADQTTCPHAVIHGARKNAEMGSATRVMRSGYCGTVYPRAVQRILRKKAQKKRFYSCYWVTVSQMRRFSPELKKRDGEEGIRFLATCKDKEEKVPYLLFNAAQLDNRSVLNEHVKNLNEQNACG